MSQGIDDQFPGLEEGSLLVTNVRNLALPHFTTAELVKSPGAGTGRAGELRAKGELTKYTFSGGRIVWTFRVDDAEFEIVSPSLSVLAQPPVAVVDKYAKKHDTEKLAEAYLRFLYSPTGQEIIARNHYRPVDPAVSSRHSADFPKIELVTIKDFGGWSKAQATHFSDGGVFDQLVAK